MMMKLAIKEDKEDTGDQVRYDQLINIFATSREGGSFVIEGKMIHNSEFEQPPYGFDKLSLNKMWWRAWLINHSAI